jgi:hypothetical protein
MPRLAQVVHTISHCLHLVLISPYREREATFNWRILGTIDRILERAARQKCLLVLLKSYDSKFLPVIDKRFFRQDLMNCNFALTIFVSGCEGINGNWRTTSRNFSMGT